MIKRGVIFFILSFLFNSQIFSASEIVVNYTVIPDTKNLSGEPDKYGQFSKGTTGGFHNLISELFKDTKISTSFLSYDSYFSALENTTVYPSSSNPEIMLGVTFSEDYTKYLDYVSVPIFTDKLVLVANKKDLPAKFKFSDNFEKDIKNLNLDIALVKGLNIPYLKFKNFSEYKTPDSAFEQVFLNNKVFITSKTLIDKYFEKNKDSKKLNNLEVIGYKDYPIYYFFVINKKSSLFTTKFDENNFITDILFKRLQDIIDSNSISKIIEQK